MFLQMFLSPKHIQPKLQVPSEVLKPGNLYTCGGCLLWVLWWLHSGNWHLIQTANSDIGKNKCSVLCISIKLDLLTVLWVCPYPIQAWATVTKKEWHSKPLYNNVIDTHNTSTCCGKIYPFIKSSDEQIWDLQTKLPTVATEIFQECQKKTSLIIWWNIARHKLFMFRETSCYTTSYILHICCIFLNSM
jgi:hypothetical protein